MIRRNPNHNISETRDWARMILAAGVAVAMIVVAAQGEVPAAALAHAISLLRR